MEDLSNLELSASNMLRVLDGKGRLREVRLSDESAGHATGLIWRVGKLRELVSRMDVKYLDKADVIHSCHQGAG